MKFHKDLNWSLSSERNFGKTSQSEWGVQFDVHKCKMFQIGDKQS